MNNKGMVFLLLAVVLAAMVLITVTRPEPSGVAGSDAPANTVAQAPDTRPAATAPAASGQTPPAAQAATPQASTAGQAAATPATTTPAATQAPTPASTPAATRPVQSTPPAQSTPSAQTSPPAQASQPAQPAQSAQATQPAQPAQAAPSAPATPATSATPARPATPAQPAASTPAPTPASQPAQAAQTGAASQAQPQVDPNSEHSLSIMALRFAGQGMVLKIQAEDAFTCKSFVLPSPDRLVVDLGGTWKNMRAPMVPDNNLIKAVRTGRQDKAARLVLDLARPLKKFETVRVTPSEVEIHME